jgi:flagellar basal-body rod protein FlgC
MGLFTGMNISASALTAQKLRLDLISNNIANINTTNTGETTSAGNPVPYRREVAVFSSRKRNAADFASYLAKNNKGINSEGVQVTRL